MSRFLVLLALALAAAGCQAPARDGKATPPLTKVRIVTRNTIARGAWPIADAAGDFRARGIEVEWSELARNQDALPSLLEGRIDVLAGSISPGYFNAIARGARLRFVAEDGHYDPAGCTYAALVVRRGLLKNGRLGRPPAGRPWRVDLRPGAMSDYVLGLALAREGIPRSDVTTQAVPTSAEELALRNGQVDVAYTLGERLPRQLATGDAELWHAAEELAPGFPYLAVLFGPSLLERDRALGVRVMAAYMEGVRRYSEGKTEANLAILERDLRIPRDGLLAACWMPIAANPTLDTGRLDEYQRWTATEGLLDRFIPASDYYDGSFIEAARAQLGGPKP